MIEKPIVSLIVPVFNSELYIKECIKSIICQDYISFELILVDDGSSDQSPDLCDYYSESDARIRVIHKENGGVSSARNAGLDCANGKYILFVDSDDYLESRYLSDLLLAADKNENTDRTLFLSDYQPFSEKGEQRRRNPGFFSSRLFTGGMTEEQFDDLIFGFRLFPPYCKLYRKDIIDRISLRFDQELKSAEDFDFNMRYIKEIDRICYIPSFQYYYRVDYKTYTPSNHGVLGNSEIKSAHIMAGGISGLARRVGLYEKLYDRISLWAANKHYFNRLPMLFYKSSEVGLIQRYNLYRKLVEDMEYRKLYRDGRKLMKKTTTKTIALNSDNFFSWYVFYTLVSGRNKN